MTTSFVGREAELAEVGRLLRGQARLVTLTGVGGVGKSRLARQVALAAERRFPDGVVLTELSALQDPDLLALAVSESVGLQDQSVRPQVDVLIEFLGPRRMLLVLDTCEHLVPECAALAEEILRAAPKVRILATSRERLGVGGEQLFVVPPLPVPELEDGAQTRNDAVELFARRAVLVDRDFRVTRANRAAVIRLCRRLDGIPLAIELAVGRLRVLTVEQLSERLTDRFRMLRGGRAALSRHDTLRTTIGWSHELCTPPERLLWARLSVFAGGFSLEAAENVCADEQVPADDILDLVTALVDKSIVLPVPGDGPSRFQMLDTLRDYGREWLHALGEEETVLRRHLDYYRVLARQFHESWSGSQQLMWADRITEELPDIRAALDYAMRTPLDALDLVGRLNFFWVSRAAKEGGHQLQRALAAAGELDTPERARALWGLAWTAFTTGDTDLLLTSATQCREIAERVGDPHAAAYAVTLQGTHAAIHGDVYEAIIALLDAVHRHLTDGDRVIGLPITLLILCNAYTELGQLEAALSDAEAARAVCDEHGEIWVRAYSEFFKARIALARDDPTAAVLHARNALRPNILLDHRLGIALAVDALAGAAMSLGEAEEAARLFGVAQRLSETTGLGYSAMSQLRTTSDQEHAESELGQTAFESATTQGAGLRLHEAIAFALGELAPAQHTPPETGVLTRRETQIAHLIAEGLSNRQIGERLYISPRTVDAHVGHILAKLDYRSRTEIATWTTRLHQDHNE